MSQGGSAGSAAGSRWRSALRLAVFALFLVFLAVLLARQWQEVRPLLGRLSFPGLLAAAASVLAGHLAIFLSWRALLTDLGARLPPAAGLRVFFLGQLGKYVPGSIWPALAHMELGRDYRVPQRVSGAALAVTMLMAVGSALLVAVLLIPVAGLGALGRYWWIVVALPVVVVIASPPVLNRLLGLALRVARRSPLPRPLSSAGALRSVGWALAAWVCYGVHVWLLAHQLGVPGGLPLLALSTGAFAGAWCAGFLLVIVPAGAGAREAALILLLAPAMSAPQATVIAVVSRLLMTIGDLAWGGVAALAGRGDRVTRSRSAAPPDRRAGRSR
jgi:glycosyltransferase 2 family protein